MRHPGYLGTILLWFESGLALGNWLSTLVVTGMMLGIYGYRIRSEEVMLVEEFGEAHEEYRGHRWRLLPFLY